MAAGARTDIEELALCSWCGRPFDEEAREPKLLACKHTFCLQCARTALAGAGGCVRCGHCARRTDPPAGRADRLPTHRAVRALARRLRSQSPPADTCAAHRLPALWCCVCVLPACRACPEHAAHAHALRAPHEARALLADESRALAAELRRLDARHRDLVARALHATTALKLRLEDELAAPEEPPPPPSALLEAASPGAAAAERDRLRAAHADALLRARLDEAVRTATTPLDFERVRRALSSSAAAGGALEEAAGEEARDPLVLLASYCAGAAYMRRGECGGGGPRAPLATAFPLLYFELEVDGAPFGRVVVEARTDVAPRMSRNFEALAAGGGGGGGEGGGRPGYRGCAVFQCWENESVITGDVELNNGRGGRAALHHGPFLPDDSRLSAVRGAVGMRRSQRRHDNLGLVASQFRIVLREMRGFTAIFGFVAEGLELVDRLSRTGDAQGKPARTILIAACGRLN